MTGMRRVVVGLVLLLFVGGCSGSEPGSEEDLAGQVDALDLPPSVVQIGDRYVAECPSPCPVYIRWYDATAPIDLSMELQRRIEATGATINDASAGPTMFYARSRTHVFFVVTDAAMISRNQHAPPGADAEVVVQLLPQV